MFKILAKSEQLILDEILATRKIVAFPRKSGRCLVHNIPYNLYDSSEVILRYLDYIDADLVKGDIINKSGRQCENFFFDGNEIININIISCKLPPVIENDIPLLYYENNTDNVYFDHSLVKDQCVTNIRYELINDNKYGVYTTFIYNECSYKIIFDYINDTNDPNEWIMYQFDKHTYMFVDKQVESKILDTFIRLLSSGYKMAFSYYSVSYERSMANILFLNMNLALEIEWWHER